MMDVRITEALEHCYCELAEKYVDYANQVEENKARHFSDFIGLESEAELIPYKDTPENLAKIHALTYLWTYAGLSWEKGAIRPERYFELNALKPDKDTRLASEQICQKYLGAFKFLPEFKQSLHDYCREKGQIDPDWDFKNGEDVYYNFEKKEGPHTPRAPIIYN
jgi:hypothetical protein